LQYDFLEKNVNVDLVGHQSTFIEGEKIGGSVLLHSKPIETTKINLGKMLLSNILPTRSVILRRSIELRFPEGNNLSEDYSLWLAIITSGYQVMLMKAVLAYTFRAEYSLGGYSGQLWTQEKRELNSLKQLFIDKNFSAVMLIFASVWSLLKFILRVVRANVVSFFGRKFFT
jgi:hypothetical protein